MYIQVLGSGTLIISIARDHKIIVILLGFINCSNNISVAKIQVSSIQVYKVKFDACS